MMATRKETTIGLPHLAAWMARKGFDDNDVAARLGVYRETVVSWRICRRNPGLAYIYAIAAMMDIAPDRLLRPPPPIDGRPSIDDILQDAPTEVARRIADLAALWKTSPR